MQNRLNVIKPRKDSYSEKLTISFMDRAKKNSIAGFGSGLVVCVVDPQPGEHIIDCCAAPGGKALFLAAKLNGTGKISPRFN